MAVVGGAKPKVKKSSQPSPNSVEKEKISEIKEKRSVEKEKKSVEKEKRSVEKEK